jgi:uncharacterized protein
MKIFSIVLLALLGLTALAAEVIPPPPAQYFNDYAGVISPATAAQLNQRLEQFERDASSQIVVAIFSKMQSDSSIEDYTVRVAQSWKVGQKDKNNGAVLFVFTQDHKMYLQVGYGLEGVLPDALCKRIIADEITPHFKAGDFNAGLTAGVNAILAATKGEYKGTGRTVAEGDHYIHTSPSEGMIWLIVGVFFFFIIFSAVVQSVRPTTYSRRGVSPGGFWTGGWGGGGGGGGFSSGGGGGGFSGGGGSFGGGGAGGSW